MIKKILLSLCLIGIGLVNFSDASWFGQGIIGHEITNINNQNIDLYIDNSLNFKTVIGGVEKKLFAFYNTNSPDFNGAQNTYIYRGENGKLNFYQTYFNNYVNVLSNNLNQGGGDYINRANGVSIDWYYICDFVNGDFTNFSNCSGFEYTGNSIDGFNELLSNISNGDLFFYGNASTYARPDSQDSNMFIAFNISSIEKLVLININPSNGSATAYGVPFTSMTKNYGLYLIENAIYENFPTSLLYDSPIISSGGGDSDGGFNGNVELSNNDIVSYYENARGFNYNMCFVGTWNFTQSEGTFKQGNGDNIFSYFNWFYNLGTGNNATGYKLSDVGKFIDEMYGNYDIYFNYGNRYSNGDIAYIYKFDINTHILDWIDTGFNNPFDFNTYVYTFYPKTLHYYTDYWRLYYYGGDLANYCYYKLNFNNSPQEEIYGNLENDISQEQLNNIGDWKIISTNIKPNQSGNILSVSEDWSGSPIDYFVQENSSGSYEDFDAGTFFTDSFNRFKGVFGDLNPSDFGFGYLPGYIITFMLALILFRFLSH